MSGNHSRFKLILLALFQLFISHDARITPSDHLKKVIMALKQYSTGRKNMTFAEWRELYRAVDELYPDFKNQLIANLGKFTEQQMQFCYLICIGLDKPEIQNLTSLSRTTVWRWFKKYSWILSPDDNKKK